MAAQSRRTQKGNNDPARRKRKSWGQHFLESSTAIERILDSLEITPGDPILEIGPGRGAITAGMLERGARVHAVEIDPQLVQELRGRFPASLPFQLIPEDIRRLDSGRLLDELEAAAPGPRVRIVGNLPYHAATVILRKFLDLSDRVRDLHFMFQEEVAERIVADPGTPEYGFLTVLCRTRYRNRILLRLPPGAFRPPPTIRSAFLRMVPERQAGDLSAAEMGFGKLLRIAFGSRRKTLMNNFRMRLEPAMEMAGQWLEERGFPRDIRAQDLSPQDFLALYSRLHSRDMLG